MGVGRCGRHVFGHWRELCIGDVLEKDLSADPISIARVHGVSFTISISGAKIPIS